MGSNGDEAGPWVVQGALDRGFDGLDVIAVIDPLGVPLVGVEPLQDVFAPGHSRGPVQLHVVVIVEVGQLAQPEVTGQ